MSFGLTNSAGPAHTVVGLLAGELVRSTLKSISAIIQTYIDDITRDFMDALDGDLLVSECRRRHRTYIKRDAEDAFTEGLKEGGVDEPELSGEDKDVIQNWIAAQLERVGGLWDDVQKLITDYDNGLIRHPEYVDRRRYLFERIGLWGDALRDLAGYGKASAMANMMVTWRLGETEKHCRVCNRLDGKRKRLKWFTDKGYIPQEKGSETLDCGGWRCLCELRDDKGNVVLPA